MAKTNQPDEVRSAQGVGAFVLGALQPAVIINPAASKADLLFWAWAELESLHQWLEVMSTAKEGGVDLSQIEVALMVTDRLEPVLQGFDAAFKDARG